MKLLRQILNVRALLAVAKALVAVALLVWLVRSGRLDLDGVFSPDMLPLHAAGVLAVAASQTLQVVRWWRLLRLQGVRLPFREALSICLISQFLATVLPGSAGGDVVRAYYITRYAFGNRIRATSSVVMDRALGLYALLWLSVPAFLALLVSQRVGRGDARMAVAVGCLIALATASFLALSVDSLRQRVVATLPRKYRTPVQSMLHAYTTSKAELALCLALSAVSALSVVVAFFVAAHAVGATTDFVAVAAIGPVVMVSSALPISPGGIGVAEATSSLLFAQVGVLGGAAIMLVVRLWIVIAVLPGSLLYVARSYGSRSLGPAVAVAADPSD